MAKEVSASFKGETVLLTGVTGFLGKVLLEQLLRKCPDLERVYILARGKRNLSAQDRLDSIYKSELYSSLEKEVPLFREKLTLVVGDVTLPGLGLSSQDVETLSSQVSVVIHGAATTRFDEPLRKAFNTNVRGTAELLLLAKQFKPLKAFMHVSTAYANVHLKMIEEKICSLPIGFEKLEMFLSWLDDKQLEVLEPSLIKKWENTYTFTKALAEDAVREIGKDLPVAVFRPGLVTGTAYEPLVGWTDTFQGPTGRATAVYAGVVHTVFIDQNLPSNVVPVDMTTSAIIAATAQLIQSGRKEDEEIKVYNYVMNDKKVLSIEKMISNLKKTAEENPTVHMLWINFLVVTKNKYLYLLCSFLFHYLPAAIVDFTFWILRKKFAPLSLMKIHEKIDKQTRVINPFMWGSWDWEARNIKQLWEWMGPEDKAKFRFDLGSLDWDQFLSDTVLGARVYLLKDDLSTLPEARAKQSRLYWIHNILVLLILLFFLKVFYTLFF